MAIKNLGATIEVTPDGGSPVTLGSVTSVTVEFLENERIDVTCLANTSGYRDYVQTFNGLETMTFGGEWDPGDVDDLEELLNAAVPPDWSVTLSDATVIAGAGRLTKLAVTAGGYNESLKFSATVEGASAAWTIS